MRGKLVILAAVATLFVATSCGSKSSGGSTNVLAGLTAAQIVSKGYNSSANQSLQLSFSSSLKLDTSQINKSSAQAQQLVTALSVYVNSSGLSMTGNGVMESPKRNKLKMSINGINGGLLKQNTGYFETYDGKDYSSADGQTYASSGTSSSTNSTSITADKANILVKDLGLTNKGSVNRNGETDQQLSANLTTDSLFQAITDLDTSGTNTASTQQALSVFKSVLKLQSATMDLFFAQSTGHFTGASFKLQGSVNLDQLLTLFSQAMGTSLLPGSTSAGSLGSLGLTSSTNATFSNYGDASNKVSAPKVSQNAKPAFGDLLGGAFGSSSSGSSSSSSAFGSLSSPSLGIGSAGGSASDSGLPTLPSGLAP